MNGREVKVYTLPTIYDSSTNKAVSDSTVIAQYLDEAYPSTPPMFPKGSKAAIALFEEKFMSQIMHIFPLAIERVPDLLNEESRGFWLESRESRFGKPFDRFVASGKEDGDKWPILGDSLDKLSGIYDHRVEGSVWYLGETFTFADIISVAFVSWIKLIFGEESREWKIVAQSGHGRWAKQVEAAQKWLVVQ